MKKLKNIRMISVLFSLALTMVIAPVGKRNLSTVYAKEISHEVVEAEEEAVDLASPDGDQEEAVDLASPDGDQEETVDPVSPDGDQEETVDPVTPDGDQEETKEPVSPDEDGGDRENPVEPDRVEEDSVDPVNQDEDKEAEHPVVSDEEVEEPLGEVDLDEDNGNRIEISSDSFNGSNKLPRGWSKFAKGGMDVSVEVVEAEGKNGQGNVVKMWVNAVTDPSLSNTFPEALQGEIIVEQDIMVADDLVTRFFLEFSVVPSKYGNSVYNFGNDGNITAAGKTIMKYEPGQWYTVTTKINTETGAYVVTVKNRDTDEEESVEGTYGVKEKAFLGFRNRIKGGVVGQDGTICYIDNVNIYNEEIEVPEEPEIEVPEVPEEPEIEVPEVPEEPEIDTGEMVVVDENIIFTKGIGSSQKKITSLEAGLITGKVTVKNKGTKGVDSTLIVAVYQKGKAQPIGVAYSTEKIKVEESITLNAGFNVPNDNEEYFIKTFVWDNMENMAPLSKMYIFDEKGITKQ